MFAVRTRPWSVLIASSLLALWGGPAAAQTVRLTKLTDVAFGTLSTTASDVTRNQSVCAYVSTLTQLYSVNVSGSGTGGALTLAGSGAPMPYEVQWAGSSGQSTGTSVPANTTVGGFSGNLVTQTCAILASSSASLIVVLRAAALSAATAGSYSGTLTIVIAAQ